MTAPLHIQKLIDEIKESKDRWIALYTSTWTYQDYSSKKRENTAAWSEPVIVGLPARENKGRQYKYRTARDLDRILRSRDGEIALNHTVTLFSLLEKLAKEIYKHLNGQYPTDFYRKDGLAKFLKGKGFLLQSEEQKFALVKETRNCVVHHGHKAEERWFEAYKNANNGVAYNYTGDDERYNDDLYYIVQMPQVEDWHDFFLEIVQRIENFFNTALQTSVEHQVRLLPKPVAYFNGIEQIFSWLRAIWKQKRLQRFTMKSSRSQAGTRAS